MKKYAGITRDDRPFSGANYVMETGDAYEKYNFLEYSDDYQYGFVETKHQSGSTDFVNDYKKFNLINFGEEFKDQDTATGILIVFFARNPSDMKFYIVGYYKNAEVLKVRQFAHNDTLDENIMYNLKCKKEDAVLIKLNDRVPLNLPKDVRLFHQQLFIYPSTKEYSSICAKIVEDLYRYDETKENRFLQYYHQSWIVPCNPILYDIDSALKELKDGIWYRQNINDISAGDYVYIYVAKPIGGFKYKCLVLKANVPSSEVNFDEDSKYHKGTKLFDKTETYMRIKLIGLIDIPLQEVFNNVPNVSVAPQSQRQVTGSYLTLLENASIVDENKKPSLADLDDEIGGNDIYDDDISSTPRPPVIRDGVESYQRNEKVRRIALQHSGGKCAIDGCKHELFKSRSGRPYLEAHHIIPINAQSYFPNVNIDIPENVICLCPSCHREIHNGENANELVTKVFNLRNDKLKEKGINIEIEKLLEFYK